MELKYETIVLNYIEAIEGVDANSSNDRRISWFICASVIYKKTFVSKSNQQR